MRVITLLQPQKIVFGESCAAQCVDDLLHLGLSRVFIVTGPPIVKLVEPLADALKKGGASVTIYSEVATEPAIATFKAAMEAARGTEPDAVIGLGGGSAMDVAKMVAALYDGQQTIREVFGIGKLASRKLYLACLPTTAGTGSEVSQNAILLDEAEQLKKGVISPHLLPDAAYVDPLLTLTLPPDVTAAWSAIMKSHDEKVVPLSGQPQPSAGERPIIGITMGDPAGIGPELCLRALGEASIQAECVPVVFGDAAVLRRVAQACGLPEPARVMSLAEWPGDHTPRMPVVVDCAAIDAATVRPGVIDETCGRAAYACIEASIQAALRREVAAVATAPIHKEALHLAKVPYPGHTEIFAALTGAKRACMMLASDELTVSFVTTHIGLADVARSLTTDRVLEVIELTADAMRRLRGADARIGVCGLNPHAGEHGLFGYQEEQKLIEPAIAAARAKGISVEGPLSPDAAFVPARRRQVDAFVCMYHDQGHIPFKMLAFESGVNITLGLPVIRTSVDHGTAFDIAWTGRANPSSLFQAIRWAIRLAIGTPVAGQ